MFSLMMQRMVQSEEENIMLKQRMVQSEEENIMLKQRMVQSEEEKHDEIDKEQKKSPRPKASNTPRPKAPNTPRPKAPNTPRPKGSFKDEQDDEEDEDEQDDTNTVISRKTKKPQNNRIARDYDATFARCDTITITEIYNEQTAILVLTRTRGETNWKRGAWKDEEGKSYRTPQDALNALIRRTWGEKGHTSSVWNTPGLLIAERNGFPPVDLFKYPRSVIMKLDKCRGSYFGRNFSELTEADFRQI
jgi:hypothetical protein